MGLGDISLHAMSNAIQFKVKRMHDALGKLCLGVHKMNAVPPNR